MAPLTLETASAITVTATLADHQPTTRVASFRGDGERVRLVLSLAPNPPPLAPPTPVVPPKAVVSPKAVARGKLSLKTDPWTTVYLGKTRLGDTPLLNVTLPVGRHTLRLVNPEANLSSSIDVEIKPNKTTVRKLEL